MKYDIYMELGTGTFGNTYLIEDKLKNKYAAKLLIGKEKINKYISEVEILTRVDALCPTFTPRYIKSGFVVIIEEGKDISNKYIKDREYDLENSSVEFDDNGQIFCILMEYISGSTLNKSVVDPQSELTLIKTLFKSLECLHFNKLVHRDIKPGNIMIDLNGRLKLIDFGLSCFLDMCSRNIQGSIGYFSPEMMRSYLNKTRVDHDILESSDVWAAGLSLFVLFNKYNPFNNIDVGIPFDPNAKYLSGIPNSNKRYCFNIYNLPFDFIIKTGRYHEILQFALMPSGDKRASASQMSQIISKFYG